MLQIKELEIKGLVHRRKYPHEDIIHIFEIN